MRTKTLLLSAAVGAAGLLAANAQVYSVNSVGYINLTVPPGFSMIGNQLKSANNTIADLLPNPPEGTQIVAWNGTGFDIFEFADIGIGTPLWAPNGDLQLNPGGGVFIKNPTTSNFTVTLVGEVPQGSDSNTTLPAGFSIASSAVPVAGNVIQNMGFPSAEGDQILKWNGSGYDIFEFADIGIGAPIWAPSEPSVAVGEAFFVKKGAQTTWTRNFNVNQQ
jgi:hypothetical protein